MKILIVYLLFSYFVSKSQSSAAIHAKDNYKQSLYSMHDKHEIESVDIAYTIEYQHCLDCEMPRTSPVGCRHYNGDASHHESYEGALQSEVCGEVETEEREVVMQEVANPNPDGVKQE